MGFSGYRRLQAMSNKLIDSFNLLNKASFSQQEGNQLAHISSPILLNVLAQHLIVLRQRTHENDSSDLACQIPFRSLHALPTHINDAKLCLVRLEINCLNRPRWVAYFENFLIRGREPRFGNVLHFIQKAKSQGALQALRQRLTQTDATHKATTEGAFSQHGVVIQVQSGLFAIRIFG